MERDIHNDKLFKEDRDKVLEEVSYLNHPDFDRLRSGIWMNCFTDEFGQALMRCEDLCFRLNNTLPSKREERAAIARDIFGSIGSRFVLHSPFHCDFGFNIHVGENFVGNFNLTILDEAEVRIGDNVFIGPNSTLCTIIHAYDPEQRNAGIMCSKPITIHNNVWLASNVVVLPGVTIGEGAIVGAGSVVTKDVPPGVIVAGNPARIIKKVKENGTSI